MVSVPVIVFLFILIVIASKILLLSHNNRLNNKLD